jgi:uncharacterized heparinase superfamily protein
MSASRGTLDEIKAEPWLERPGPADQLRALARLPRDQALGRLTYALKRPFYGLSLMRLLPAAPGPAAPCMTPTDPWPGNAARGAAIVKDAFTLAGQTVHPPAPYWSPMGVDPVWFEALNGFAWLRDLRAAGGDQPRRKARSLVSDWMDRHRAWDSRAWAPAVTGRRIGHWLGHYDFFGATAEIEFQQRLLAHLGRQARHLARVLPAGLSDGDLIAALKGLVYAGLCLPGGEPWLRRGLDMLAETLPRQLLADGGHVTRSPACQFQVLRDLVDLRGALHAGAEAVPEDLQRAIEAMAPILRLLRHGDGGLALFHDSNEAEDWQIDLLLQRAGGRASPPMSAPDSGYQRLQAGRSLVLVDCGAPPPPGHDGHAHAGTLGFEMSSGRERMIVNCGAQSGQPLWRWAQRTTAAHSTLVVNDSNSSQLLPGGGLGRKPEEVEWRREDSEGSTWLEASHDGYREPLGVIHRRRLFLGAGGDDLRGEDRLDGAKDGHFAIRFHLHPEVQVSLVQSGGAALLRLPKGGGWRFMARGAQMSLEPSVYLGDESQSRRSEQIVLSGQVAADTSVSWALRREAKARAGRK